MKVLLVDDHPLILAALKAMIEGMQVGVQVTAVSSASSARAALQAEPDHDLVLLDLQLDETDGFQLLTELRRKYPVLSVVVISASDRSADVIRAIDLGAMGFLPKRMPTEALADALRLVMGGGIFVPTMSLDRPTISETGLPPSAPAAGAGLGEPPSALPSLDELGLTPRQAEVLNLLLQGKPNKEIARRLGLSVETVKDHVQAVLRALGVNSRTQAVLAVGQMTQRLHRAPSLPLQ
jgi:DNA-binding NarL/FixJ family response regulator